jgi:hypothetical protein
MWGNIRFMVVLTPFVLALWFHFELSYWLNPTLEIDPRRQEWHRLWVTGFAIFVYGGGVLALFTIAIRRRRAAKSAEGQWYDDPALTREALHGEQGGSAGQDADNPDAPDSAPRDERPS